MRLSNPSFSHHHHSRSLLPEPFPLPILSPTPTNPLSGVLELTHNHGTESDPAFAGYASGNADPGRGFGHIAITVDDVEAACARFEQLGVRFQKKLTDGKMKNIAFILDPDGCASPLALVSVLSLCSHSVRRYWIEILPGSYKPQ